MISRIIKKTVDLNKVQKVDQLEGPLYQLENGGHTFEITCLMDGTAAAVSGTVTARFLRQDEVTVFFTGTLSGNVASIRLPQSCYNVNGRFGLVVFIAGNNTTYDNTTAIYAVAGSVYRSTSEHIIDPTEEIPSLEDLIAKIQDCEDATEAAEAAAAFVPNVIAPAYSASGTYVVGDYCTKDGYLYRCNTAISTAEAWTAAHWTQVTTGAELGDLKSEIANAVDSITHGETDITDSITWTPKKANLYDSTTSTTSTNFKISNDINVSGYNKITVTVPVYTTSGGTQASYGNVFLDENKDYLETAYRIELGTNANKNITIDIPPTAHYIRLTYFDDAYESYTEAVDFECVLIAGNSLDGLSDRIDALSEQVDSIKTQIVLGQDEINEFYSITSSGIATASNWGVTSYIDCYGVSELSIKMPVLSSAISTVVGLDFYDQTKTKLSFVPANRGTNNGAEIRTIDVPDGAYYFRATYWKYENALQYGGDWYCSFETAQYTKYRPYQSGYIFYSPLVNQSVNQYWETDLDTELGSNMKQTTGVLLLPASYTPTGKPTPIIMYFHGYSHYVYYDHWGDDEAFRTQKAQWASMGFAVLDCNGARNNNKTGHFTSGGSLQYSDGYHKCYEYVKQHYNVEDYCHVICVSAGGIPGINYTYWFNDVKSLQMLSAWTSLRNNQYGTGVTDTMIEYLGCDFTNGYDATVVDRTIGFDPTLRIMTVDGVKYLPQGKVPMKAFLGSTEQNNHIWNAMQNYVTALRNAGQSVSLRIVDGATHKNICSDDILALNTEYANFCKSV